LVETQSGKKIKVLQTDNGGEYVNHEIHNVSHEEGIQLQNTVPYTPQQNGVAEQKKLISKGDGILHVAWKVTTTKNMGRRT
jgi:transposase InsO family protein